MNVKYVTKIVMDQEKVLKALDRAEKKALNKIGAFARRDAQRSLKRRKSVSKPGATPSVRSKSSYATLKNILFYHDKKTRSVLVGPKLINNTKVMSNKTLPELLEFGGMAEVEARDGLVRASYPARPTMGPTLTRVLAGPVISESLKNSVF